MSDRPNEEVSESERRCWYGADQRVLDIINVPVQHALPKAYQPENWLLDPRRR